MNANYRNTRPKLVVENTGGAKLGNCYHTSYYRITSTRRLGPKELRHLWDAGFIGYGQEFRVKSQHDGNEMPAGMNEVPCVDEKTGEPAVNSLSGKPYGSSNFPYYVYETESRCDSSD